MQMHPSLFGERDRLTERQTNRQIVCVRGRERETTIVFVDSGRASWKMNL